MLLCCHFGEERFRVKFIIFIRDIQFTRNDYFLKNSRYTIYQANYSKQEKICSQYNIMNIDELARLKINESISFYTSLYQDLPCKYLEKFLPKYRRIVLRQKTKINKLEYLIRDIGYLELPLHELALQPPPLHYEYDLYDPDNGADAVIRVSIDFQILLNISPRSNSLCNCLKVWRYLRRTQAEPSRDRNIVNQEHFDILKTKGSKLGVYSYSYNSDDDCEQVHQTMSLSDFDVLSQHRQNSIFLKRQGQSSYSTYVGYTLRSFQEDLVEVHPKYDYFELSTGSIADNISSTNLNKKVQYSPPMVTVNHLSDNNNGLFARPLPGTPENVATNFDQSHQFSSITNEMELLSTPVPCVDVGRQIRAKKERVLRHLSTSGIGDVDDMSETHSLSYSRSNVPSARIPYLHGQVGQFGAISSSGSMSEPDDSIDAELRFPPSYVADSSTVQFFGDGILLPTPSTLALSTKLSMSRSSCSKNHCEAGIGNLNVEINRPHSLSQDNPQSTSALSHGTVIGNCSFISLPFSTSQIPKISNQPVMIPCNTSARNLRDYGMVHVSTALDTRTREDPYLQSLQLEVVKNGAEFCNCGEFAFGISYYDLND